MKLLVVVVALAGCGAPAPAGPAPPPSPAPSPTRVPVFDYSATDGEFGYSLALASDGSWYRTEHSGTVPPNGKLSAAALRRFLAALDAAPFTTTDTPCSEAAPGQATYRDYRGDRVATSGSREDPGRGWVPCGPTVDAATERLPGCLELLISGSTAGC